MSRSSQRWQGISSEPRVYPISEGRRSLEVQVQTSRTDLLTGAGDALTARCSSSVFRVNSAPGPPGTGTFLQMAWRAWITPSCRRPGHRLTEHELSSGAVVDDVLADFLRDIREPLCPLCLAHMIPLRYEDVRDAVLRLGEDSEFKWGIGTCWNCKRGRRVIQALGLPRSGGSR